MTDAERIIAEAKRLDAEHGPQNWHKQADEISERLSLHRDTVFDVLVRHGLNMGAG